MSELTVMKRAEKALSLATRKAELSELVKQSERITSITNKAGRDECHAAAMRLKTERVAIQKTGKEARDDANAFAKAVIAVEKELVGILDPEESRLFGLRDEWDAERQREKEEAERVERERLAAIVARIGAIKSIPLEAVGKSSAAIAVLIAETGAIDVSDLEGADQIEAQAAQESAVAKLRELHDAAKETEARERELETERKRLAAEAAERAEAERVEREKREAFEAAERRKREDEERARRAAEQAEMEAERRKLEAERVAFEKEQTEARAKAEAAEAERQAKERAEREERDRQQREELAKREAEKREQDRIAREKEIAAATLESAAREALALLLELAPEHIVTAKLGSVLRVELEKAA